MSHLPGVVLHTGPQSFALGEQITAAVSPSSVGSWGPPKKSIVNVFAEAGATIPAGGHFVVYQVPNDRWLTITSTTANSQGCLCPWPSGGTAPCLRWAELSGGVYREKGFGTAGDTQAHHSPSGVGDPVGWVFRPGSQVVIRNIDASPCAVWEFSLMGYESRD